MEQVEKNILIAKRVPPGDRFVLIDEPENIHNSLTETLEAYFQKTQVKCEFRLAPLKGELYMITTEEVEPPPPPPAKKFNIYGDW
jgi:16S rRNA G1207 methylase RsmC